MRLFTTGELTSLEVKAIRELLDVAFAPDEDERFTEDDWQRAIGGMHFVLDVDGAVAAPRFGRRAGAPCPRRAATDGLRRGGRHGTISSAQGTGYKRHA